MQTEHPYDIGTTVGSLSNRRERFLGPYIVKDVERGKPSSTRWEYKLSGHLLRRDQCAVKRWEDVKGQFESGEGRGAHSGQVDRPIHRLATRSQADR